MPSKSLFQLVEELAGRTQRHSATLSQNEILTRYVLIDPLLRELGWNTEDPEQVLPEYNSGSGYADYALLSDGKPIILIESKRLDTPLQDGLAQAINHCLMEGTPYFTVTDGRRWEIYETHRPAPVAETQVVAFDLADHAPRDAILQSLELLRRSAETGSMSLPQSPAVTQAAPEPPSSLAEEISALGLPTGTLISSSGDLPLLTRSELAAMPKGEVVLCTSKADGVDFLKKYNAWGFIRLKKVPEYLALYVGGRDSAIQYFGEVDKLTDSTRLIVLNPNPSKDTDGRREGSGRGWVRELQGRWPGVLG